MGILHRNRHGGNEPAMIQLKIMYIHKMCICKPFISLVLDNDDDDVQYENTRFLFHLISNGNIVNAARSNGRCRAGGERIWFEG